jgi:hypothetical protein
LGVHARVLEAMGADSVLVLWSAQTSKEDLPFIDGD